MQMRGVQKQNSATTTSAFTGIFLNNDATRREFINLVQAKLHFLWITILTAISRAFRETWL
jgi:hypothetical protein